jgi:ssDNA thymidine ADP-ribosyltransferase, DarT
VINQRRTNPSAQIYHLTHVENLESIIARGGLCCDGLVADESLLPIGIAHAHIKDRRARRAVPIGTGGFLCDYVPFYFAPRSPMLYAIYRRAVEGYTGTQREILHLVSSTDAVVAAGVPFVFTEGHAELFYSEFFTDLGDLNRIDWEIMQARIWRDTISDGDRKRRRQAEFLAHRFFPWQLITEIGVANKIIALEVESKLGEAAHKPSVTVRPGWYY